MSQPFVIQRKNHSWSSDHSRLSHRSASTIIHKSFVIQAPTIIQHWQSFLKRQSFKCQLPFSDINHLWFGSYSSIHCHSASEIIYVWIVVIQVSVISYTSSVIQVSTAIHESVSYVWLADHPIHTNTDQSGRSRHWVYNGCHSCMVSRPSN